MTRKSDWEAAAEEFMFAERERLGGPPTPEEVVAYSRGELSEADAARVLALLVYYPGLTSVLIESEPSPISDFLTAEELAKDWSRIRARIAGEAGKG